MPADEGARANALQLQLTVMDVAAEGTTRTPHRHHLYYEEQKPEAVRRATGFVEQRIPKFLGWFERGWWPPAVSISWAVLHVRRPVRVPMIEGLE